LGIACIAAWGVVSPDAPACRSPAKKRKPNAHSLMRTESRAFLFSLLWAAQVQAADVEFAPREMFRMPFGSDRAALGAKIDGQEMKIPSDFAMDAAGRFYIYDIHKNRIARYSPEGKFQITYTYAPTVQQVFAHVDAQQNMWLLVTDPKRGAYYGVYDERGKTLRSGFFTQYNRFRLRLADDAMLRVTLYSDKQPTAGQLYWFDQDSMLLKRDTVGPPPENQHQIQKEDVTYSIHLIPGSGKAVNRITDRSSGRTRDIEGEVVYISLRGELYTRVGDREIRVYDVSGKMQGRMLLTGLPSSLKTIRFTPAGDICQLDGIPDRDGAYTSDMPGMRIVCWQR